MQATEEATRLHVAKVQDMLLEGEAHAVQTLISALEATTTAKSGKRVVVVPDWPSRIKAAESLLNRRGERGKPIDRVRSANLNSNTPEVRIQLEPTFVALSASSS